MLRRSQQRARRFASIGIMAGLSLAFACGSNRGGVDDTSVAHSGGVSGSGASPSTGGAFGSGASPSRGGGSSGGSTSPSGGGPLGSGGEPSGGLGGGGGDGTGGGADGPTLILDPESLGFSYSILNDPDFPTDSGAYVVAGYAPDAGLCVRMRWFFNTGTCDEVYRVNIQESTAEECDVTSPEYAGDPVEANATVEQSVGCMDWYDQIVQAEVRVESDLFTGRIVADNLTPVAPASVWFGLVFDPGKNVGRLRVLRVSGSELEPWIRATKGEETVHFFQTFGAPGCDDPRPTKDLEYSLEERRNRASLFVVWDGNLWIDQQGGCPITMPAPPGDYAADLCYSTVDDVTPDTECVHVDFTLPTQQVIGRTSLQ